MNSRIEDLVDMPKNQPSLHDEFKPDLTPQQMLELGVFGGAYFGQEDMKEFPAEWFKGARLSVHGPDPACNYFGVLASQPHKVWAEKGWLSSYDPLGWFQWYCRYYQGRRIDQEDERQIKRWKAMRRHVGQIRKACHPGDAACHTKQRQALLHWAYDSRNL